MTKGIPQRRGLGSKRYVDPATNLWDLLDNMLTRGNCTSKVQLQYILSKCDPHVYQHQWKHELKYNDHSISILNISHTVDNPTSTYWAKNFASIYFPAQLYYTDMDNDRTPNDTAVQTMEQLVTKHSTEILDRVETYLLEQIQPIIDQTLI